MRPPLTLVAFFLCISLHCDAQDRPNILWITSEDNGTFLGCYGDPIARTPNLDSLASKGTLYTNFFANAPVCAVARNSWLMGTPAVRLGTHHMRSRYRIPIQTFIPYPTALREAGYYTTNNAKTDYNSNSVGKELWHACNNKAHYKNRADGQPFFAVFNIGNSHESGIFDPKSPKTYADLITPADSIQIPPYQVDTPEVREDWRRSYDRIHDMDRRVGALIKELEANDLLDDTIIAYCSDHGGITLRSKRYLYDSGTRVPLIVYFPPKWSHLRPTRPGGTSDRLAQFIDLPISFLAIANAAIPSTMNGTRLWGPQQSKAPEYVFLFSGRFDEAPDMRRGLTDERWKYIRNYEPDRPRFQMLSYPLRQRGQQSQLRKYRANETNSTESAFYEAQPYEELYDRFNDPHEIDNLAQSPDCRERLQTMREALDQMILKNRDTGFIPEPLMAQIDANTNTSIYAFAQSSENYPIETILVAANKAAQGSPRSIPSLISFSESENSILRYWSAIGLRVLGAKASPAESTIRKLCTDSNFSVRIQASVALANIGDRETAITQLIDEANHSANDQEAMWVLDALQRLEIGNRLTTDELKSFDRGAYSKRIVQTILESRMAE